MDIYNNQKSIDFIFCRKASRHLQTTFR